MSTFEKLCDIAGEDQEEVHRTAGPLAETIDRFHAEFPRAAGHEAAKAFWDIYNELTMDCPPGGLRQAAEELAGIAWRPSQQGMDTARAAGEASRATQQITTPVVFSCRVYPSAARGHFPFFRRGAQCRPARRSTSSA